MGRRVAPSRHPTLGGGGGRPPRATPPPQRGDPPEPDGLTVTYHSGLLPGSTAVAGRRSDGVSVVIVLNSDLVLGGADPWTPRAHGNLTLGDLRRVLTLMDEISAAGWPSFDLFELAGYPPLP